MLFEVFNLVGPIASIRICRDAVTRRSLGYGYVNFLNTADAERGLESLNYTPIRGTPMRIMWSNRDPGLRRAGTGNIFIKNLDPSIDQKALHDTFAAFGNILSCKIAMKGERSLGYAFVHYETLEQAEEAIKAVDGMLLNDTQVYVGLHIPKKERQNKLDETRAKFTNIYVKNIDPSIDQAAFEALFLPFGPVVSCVLAVHDDGKSKEFGFVNYEQNEDARKAVEEMHEKEINGKQLYVGRAQKKAEREEELRRQYDKVREEKMIKYQGINLYVKNLDEAIDDEKLRLAFAPFGVITSCKVMIDERSGASKGFGFVCFTNPDEATKAVTEMNGHMLNNKPIYVALAQRKDVRRQQLAVQMQQRQIRMQQPMMPGYPGAPMFYPGMPPQARGFYSNQPQMNARPRWNGPGQPQMMGQPGGFPGQQYPGMMNPAGGRPPRQPRPNGRGQSMPPQQNGPRPMGVPGMPGQGVLPPNVGRGRGNYKYTPNARNAPNQQQSQGNPQLNAASLASLPPDQQKHTLGEALYRSIAPQAGPHAGKVTGMLLEMDNSELLHLLESPEALNGKVIEAVAALEEHLRAQAE